MADEVLLTTASKTERTRLYEKNVTVAGTPEKLFPERVYANRYFITSKPSNTGAVYFMVEDPTTPGSPGSVKLPISGLSNAAEESKNFDMSKIWVDADVNGDGVIVKYNSTGTVI